MDTDFHYPIHNSGHEYLFMFESRSMILVDFFLLLIVPDFEIVAV